MRDINMHDTSLFENVKCPCNLQARIQRSIHSKNFNRSIQREKAGRMDSSEKKNQDEANQKRNACTRNWMHSFVIDDGISLARQSEVYASLFVR